MAHADKASSLRKRLKKLPGYRFETNGFLDRLMATADDKLQAEIKEVYARGRPRIEEIYNLIDEALQALSESEGRIKLLLNASEKDKAELDQTRRDKRDLLIVRRALEAQVKELQRQRDSAQRKLKQRQDQSHSNAQLAHENTGLKDQLAQAQAEIKKLKAQAKAKDEAHARDQENKKRDIEGLRSTVANLQANRAEMKVQLEEAQRSRNEEREAFDQVVREMQTPRPLGATDQEFAEMSHKLSQALTKADQATRAAQSWKRQADENARDLADMQEHLAEAMRINANLSQADQNTEIAALRQELETAMRRMQQLVQANKPDQAVIQQLMEQNQLLSERLQEVTKNGSYWHGVAKASQAECARLSQQLDNLQEQLRQIAASDDDMIRRLLKEQE